jgi:predicted nucleic acid-binding protein
MRKTIVDAGPLIAILKKDDPDKAWAEATLRRLPPPIHTVEPVLTEVAYFVAAAGGSWVPLMERLLKKEILVSHPLAALAPGAIRVGNKYPQADLADAAIVALYEQLDGEALVVTLDHDDFTVYRTADRRVIDFVSPSKNSSAQAGP